MWQFILKPLKRIINTVWSASCLFCQAPEQTTTVCAACLHDLPWLINACWSCAQPLTTSQAPPNYCGRCLQKSPAFDRTLALFHYQKPITYLISALKFNKKLAYAKFLGDLLAEHLPKHYENDSLPECLIPLPLHPARTRQRGFNQSFLLAHRIAKHLKLAINTTACQRIKNTTTQRGLNSQQRQKNMRQAFSIAPNFAAKHVVIIDDVVTTGSTVHALSRLLKQRGVQRVDVWSVARTSIAYTKY